MLTLSNLITLLRLPAIPFIVWLSYGSDTGRLVGAAGLFSIAAATDWLDGYLARRSGTCSTFGTLMDPLVDKLLILSVLFVFSHRALIPLWLVLLNMFRELLVTAVRHGVSSRAKVLAANWMGKTKFCLQVALVELVYLYLLSDSLHRPLPGGQHMLFWSAVGVTAVSFAFLLVFMVQHRQQYLADGPQPPSAPT